MLNLISLQINFQRSATRASTIDAVLGSKHILTTLLQRAFHLAELFLCRDEFIITLAENAVGIVNHAKLHLFVFGFVLGTIR